MLMAVVGVIPSINSRSVLLSYPDEIRGRCRHVFAGHVVQPDGMEMIGATVADGHVPAYCALIIVHHGNVRL